MSFSLQFPVFFRPKFEFHKLSQKPSTAESFVFGSSHDICVTSEKVLREKPSYLRVRRLIRCFNYFDLILRQWSGLARFYWKLILIVLYWIISRRLLGWCWVNFALDARTNFHSLLLRSSLFSVCLVDFTEALKCNVCECITYRAAHDVAI